MWKIYSVATRASDLPFVFSVGLYEDQIAHKASWVTGDWNCDGEFDSGDLVESFSTGAFQIAAIAAAPSSRSLSSPAMDTSYRLAAVVVDSIFDRQSTPLNGDADAKEVDDALPPIRLP